MCACAHVLGIETRACHSQANTPALSLISVEMLWTLKLFLEVLSNRWAEARKSIAHRGSSVSKCLVWPRVKVMSDFQEAKSWPAVSSRQGRGRAVEKRLSSGDLRAVCCIHLLISFHLGEPDPGDQWPYSVAPSRGHKVLVMGIHEGKGTAGLSP